MLRGLLPSAGDVETNPCPVEKWRTIKKIIFAAILREIHEDDPTFSIPSTKAEMITQFESQDQKMVNMAMKMVQRVSNETGSKRVSSKRVKKLPDF